MEADYAVGFIFPSVCVGDLGLKQFSFLFSIEDVIVETRIKTAYMHCFTTSWKLPRG